MQSTSLIMLMLARLPLAHYNHPMDNVINWIYSNLTLVTVLLSAVAALGAAYPLLKDLIPWLLRLTWEIIRTLFIFFWWIIIPIRRPLGVAIAWLLNKLFNWIESKGNKEVESETNKSS